MTLPKITPHEPIFYDASEKRWLMFKRFALAISLGLAALVGSLSFSLLHDPRLPKLTLKETFKAALHPSAAVQDPKINAPLELNSNLNSNLHPLETFASKPTSQPTSKPSPNPSKSSVIGFYVNWDDNSFSSLKANLGSLDKLMPEWLHLRSGGNLQIDDPIKQSRALEYIRAHKPSLKIMALINNFDSTKADWNGEMLAKVLSSETSRKHLIDGLEGFVKSNHLNGVNIDFETVPGESQANLERFMTQLYARFHPQHLEVSQSVPLDDPDFDYVGLSKVNDYLVLMGYDEHENSSVAGSVASLPWVMHNLRSRLAQVPANKYVLALGNYGYDWTQGKAGASELSFQDAQTLAQESQGKIALEPQSLTPHFDYYDDANALHHVWFLDAPSLYNEIRSSADLHLNGYALWRLGQEDPSIWQVFDGRANLGAQAARGLSTLHYGYDINYQGAGEILKVTATPKDGSRNIVWNPTNGLIVGESLERPASPYVITRWGATKAKKIALTFDDGPDPLYTPQVLDLLKAAHVPATFFVIGMNADLYPDLTKRIYLEGHQLGVHTFTHPNLSLVTPAQFAVELNATQRLLEEQLGVSSLLFRPPFAEDVEPETPDQAGAVTRAGDMGYYTVGMGIDPLDWATGASAAKIVQDTLQQIHSGEGQVVLLHDAGGNRAATVAALPILIRTLRAEGYQLVGVADLMGVNRDTVMPKVGGWLSHFNATSFGFLELATYALQWLFMVGIALSVARISFIALLALFESYVQGRRKRALNPLELPSATQPSVAVIVPAYNEEKVILKTLTSLLEQDFFNFEIIVVDDGSKDQTLAKVQERYGNHPRVRTFRIPNGGKSGALNFGMQQTEAEVVVLLDADTVLNPQAVRLLLGHFADPKIAAVAGNAKVGNRLNLLTRIQALEYISSQNLERRAFALLGCISVVPGAIGAWRRSILQGQGGFASDTLAEDADLTLRLLRSGYHIGYEQAAIAYTEAPDTVRDFLKQRFRWMFGTLQATWKHRDTLFRPRYGALGSITLPNVFIFQIAFPFVSALLDIAMLVSLLWTALQSVYHPLVHTSSSPALLYYLIFLGVDMLVALLAFALERNEDWSLIPWLPLQRFFYRQLLYIVAIQAALSAIKGRMVGWGTLERKATVKV